MDKVKGAFLMCFRKIKCPICGKWLFDAKDDTKGCIYAFCKRCRKSVLVELKGA
jgi:hypothetical protein